MPLRQLTGSCVWLVTFYNSGGGYQYRLCPADKMPCTEQDFQQMPLDFVRGSQAIMACRAFVLCLCLSTRICMS